MPRDLTPNLAPCSTLAACTGQGPEGCNLFVFHIPNDMTNLKLYELFVKFGDVVSTRIMVDKDTGRSRGFGFVSFDNPHSADMAIQKMSGFQIGHKRYVRTNLGRTWYIQRRCCVCRRVVQPTARVVASVGVRCPRSRLL